jgi:CRP/FNR family transcriptional regulator
MADFEQRVEDFFVQFTKQKFKKGDTIIWGGREPEGVYYLKEGHVRQYSISEHTGNLLTLHIFHPKSFFPMIWAMANKPNSYFFESMGPVVVYRAPKGDVLRFLKQDNEVLSHFSIRLLSGLNGILIRLETLAFTDVYGRLISELLYLAKHFGRPHKTGTIIGTFTHQELADFVGSARETVSVAMEKLEKKKLVEYIGHTIFIPDPNALVIELKRKRGR